MYYLVKDSVEKNNENKSDLVDLGIMNVRPGFLVFLKENDLEGAIMQFWISGKMCKQINLLLYFLSSMSTKKYT